MDIVITDHHDCKDALPDAVAVVDPRRPGLPLSLQGAGRRGRGAEAGAGPDRPKWSAPRCWSATCDLAAIGTVADVMRHDRTRTAPSSAMGLAGLIPHPPPGPAGAAAGGQRQCRPPPPPSASATASPPGSTPPGGWSGPSVALELLLTRDAGAGRAPGSGRCASSTGSARPSSCDIFEAVRATCSPGARSSPGRPSCWPERAGIRAWWALWPPVWRSGTPAPPS